MATPFTVPTVDISPYLSSPTSPQAQEIITAIRDACTTNGFFQITNHGISPELQEAVFEGSKRFFDLPMEEKEKLDKSKSVGASNRGYELIGNQGLQTGTLPDLKEGFYISQHIPATDPRVTSSAFLIGPNIWPPASALSPSLFQHPMENYYTSIFSLSLQIIDIIAAGMPYGPHVFDDFVSNDAVAAVRLLHYPPDNSQDERQLGAGAHTDFGCVTLLMQDGTGGLQVWNDEGEGKWYDVKPVKGAYVVNVGDMLQMWTKGKYKSALHRVVNRSGSDRYSVPFFFDGNLKCVLRPLDGSAKVDEVFPTVEEHMKGRFTSTYARGKERDDGLDNCKV